jgi:Major intrinsic protein
MAQRRPVPAAGDRAGRVTGVPLWRRLLAELVGSAFLAAVVIGSGIAAQRLSPGQTGLELLENAAATAAGLYAIILMVGPVSGGHFNPVVSAADAVFGGLRWRDAAAYIPAQAAARIIVPHPPGGSTEPPHPAPAGQDGAGPAPTERPAR